MADYRQIHTKIWNDEWFLDLDTEAKLLFIYLFSNPRSCLAGIYDIPVKLICFDTGLGVATVKKLLADFEKKGKAFYLDGWVFIPKLMKYNASNLASPKVVSNLKATVDHVPDGKLKALWMLKYGDLIGYAYGINTPFEIEKEQEQEQEQEQNTEQEQEQEQEQNSGAKTAPSASADLQTVLSEWAMLFPKKPQPKPTTVTLQRQAKTRMQSTDFRDSWRKALAMAAHSEFCNAGAWFDLYWFLKNDDNWRKCLAGKYGNGHNGSKVAERDRPNNWRAMQAIDALIAEQEEQGEVIIDG